jgi:hypothetical protein
LVPLLCAIAGVLKAGTAGVIAARPFTGEMELDLPCCCTGAAPSTATAEDEFEELVAIAGDETAFLVAEAYDWATCDALEVLEAVFCGCGDTEVMEKFAGRSFSDATNVRVNLVRFCKSTKCQIRPFGMSDDRRRMSGDGLDTTKVVEVNRTLLVSRDQKGLLSKGE